MSHDAHSTAPRLPDGTLLEGLVTTLAAAGSPHIAPMGPIVNADFTRLLLRPYRTSTTYQNLARTREGVLHVSDDVELFARAAVGAMAEMPPMFPARVVQGMVVADACRWYEFRVSSLDDTGERSAMVADVVAHCRIRDFFGFNRGKHAVLEAAILATRVDLLDAHDIRQEFTRLQAIVEKTGGRHEHAAFGVLRAYIDERLTSAAR